MRKTAVALLLNVVLSHSLTGEDTSSEIEFFEKRIRPVLVAKCYECHSTIAADIKGGLTLD
ncbi:MAG: hypothetical protein MK324_14520 [Pirellulales bacterium]|nr:hypothetical protein [Pirellulales bacterium]